MKTFQQKIKSWWYRQKYPTYRSIDNAKLFDPVFYTNKYEDVAASGVDPLLHYILIGFAEPRQPHLLFDLDLYFSQVPGLHGSGVNPLSHYIEVGWRANYRPNYLFSPLRYMEENSDADFSCIDPFGHYLSVGSHQGRRPHIYFDPLFYAENNSDVDFLSLDPILHFISHGRFERRRPSLEFDIVWYKDRTPVDPKMHRELLVHYQNFGAKERKTPSPLFDPRFYEDTYGLHHENDLFRHYLLHADNDEIKPCHWFDPLFYRQHYLKEEKDDDSAWIRRFFPWRKTGKYGKKKIVPFADYLEKGVWKRRYPNREVADLAHKPLISIVVPVFNPSSAHLSNCISSVLYQSYPHWQLCLADDCSTDAHVSLLLTEWAAKDSRIKVVFLEHNLGISGATNAAAALATGDYLGFLDNDDELANECLYHLVQEINKQSADLLYTDEDLIGEDGRRFSVFAKPDFNEELLLCHNYITHFVCVQRLLYEKVGGCNSAMNGAQDYDLFLKLAEQAKKIVHIPEILYHWRASDTSTSINHSQKEYANEAGRRALIAAVERRGLAAEIQLTEFNFYYRTRRIIVAQPLVSVVVYWNQEHGDIVSWLQELEHSAGYRNFAIVLVTTNGNLQDQIDSYMATTDQPISSWLMPEKCSLAEIYTLASAQSDGELLAFVSSAISRFGQSWLAALVEYGNSQKTGIVGGRLDFTGEAPVEVTPTPQIDNLSPLYYSRFIQQCSVLLNGLDCAQEVRSVNPEFCLLNAKLLAGIGGFNNEKCQSLFVIHDVCYRLQQQGLKNFYTPYATASWQGDARRFDEHRYNADWKTEQKCFQNKWRDFLLQGDPFFTTGALRQHNVGKEDFQKWLTGS